MNYNRADILAMLSAEAEQAQLLFERAAMVKRQNVGDGLYLRGLIEYSNICRKNCLYCGIRHDNKNIERYVMSHDEVVDAAQVAYNKHFGSVVIQGGEVNTPKHIERIEKIIKDIKRLSNGELGITLSLGEQSVESYQRWFAAGAHRYLLRIESSSSELYTKIHPADDNHCYEDRLAALKSLRQVGFQVGTGVMIGLPFQTIDNLIDDIIFMQDLDIDMCGMGPYIPSIGSPLTTQNHAIPSQNWRLEMTLKMVATLRIVMPDINIAATTALSSLSADGRYMAIECGANIIMPNITPPNRQENYNLYDNKSSALDARMAEFDIKYGEWGDSPRFVAKKR